MADPKRQSGGGKVSVATPNIGSSVTVNLETALSGSIGARIRITASTPQSSTLEGILYIVDPLTNLVALNTLPPLPTPITSNGNPQPSDYHIFPISRISAFQLLSLPASSADTPTFTNAQPPLYALDLRALKAREAAAINKLQERENRRGKGVTKEAQELFDAFHKTLPTRWEGTSIVISDSVAIESPYVDGNCRPLSGVEGGEQALPRVKKVLAMERAKMDLKKDSGRMNSTVNAAATRVAIPAPPVPTGVARKGG